MLVNERKQHLAKQGGAAAGGGGAAQSVTANQLRSMSDEELNSKSVKELMAMMRTAGVDTSGCIEKSDLIDHIKGKPAV